MISSHTWSAIKWRQPPTPGMTTGGIRPTAVSSHCRIVREDGSLSALNHTRRCDQGWPYAFQAWVSKCIRNRSESVWTPVKALKSETQASDAFKKRLSQRLLLLRPWFLAVCTCAPHRHLRMHAEAASRDTKCFTATAARRGQRISTWSKSVLIPGSSTPAVTALHRRSGPTAPERPLLLRPRRLTVARCLASADISLLKRSDA